MFKVNNKDTKDVVQWRRSGAFVGKSENIPHLSVVFLMLTLNK